MFLHQLFYIVRGEMINILKHLLLTKYRPLWLAR